MNEHPHHFATVASGLLGWRPSRDSLDARHKGKEINHQKQIVPPVSLHTGTEQYANPVAREVAQYFSSDVMPEVAAFIDDLDLEITAILPPQE